MVGRAAAQRIARNGPIVSSTSLKSEIARTISTTQEFANVDIRLATAGGLAEAATIELRKRKPLGHLAGLRHLARPSAWRHRLTRTAARSDLRVAVVRALERAGVR